MKSSRKKSQKNRSTNYKKRCFSLLEVVIAIFLFALATGGLGWNVHQMIVRKQFSASVEKLRDRLLICRRLALNSQSDWRCTLQWNGKEWTVLSQSMEGSSSPSFPDLELGSFHLVFNGEKSNLLTFDFTATGEVLPRGTLQMRRKAEDPPVEWKIPTLFSVEEGEKGGPSHPNG